MQNSRDTVNSLEIASPCHMSWEEMEGDDRVRFCKSCRLNVFNISAMDVEEAAELIAGSTDRLCVRLYRRRDGTVLTQDCPVGFRAALRRRMAAIAGSVTVGLGMLASLVLRPAARRAPIPTTTPFKVIESPVPPPPVVDPPQQVMGQMVVGEVPARLGRISTRPVPRHPGLPKRR